MSIPKLIEILGDQNGIVYVDGIPMLKIRRYDVTQATPIVATAAKPRKHDVTQAKREPGELVYCKGRMVPYQEHDADGNTIPLYD